MAEHPLLAAGDDGVEEVLPRARPWPIVAPCTRSTCSASASPNATSTGRCPSARGLTWPVRTWDLLEAPVLVGHDIRRCCGAAVLRVAVAYGARTMAGVRGGRSGSRLRHNVATYACRVAVVLAGGGRPRRGPPARCTRRGGWRAPARPPGRLLVTGGSRRRTGRRSPGHRWRSARWSTTRSRRAALRDRSVSTGRVPARW